MATPIWSPVAEDDLRELAYYIGVEQQSPQGAQNLIDGIREKCELVASNPEIGERPLARDFASFQLALGQTLATL